MFKLSWVKKLNNMKIKLIVVPLILLSLAIGALAISTFGFVETSLFMAIEKLGLDVAHQARQRVVDNREALIVIQEFLAEKIIGVGQTVLANKDILSNEFLTQVALDSGIDSIHFYNPDLEIIFTAFDQYLGWQAPADHPVAVFARSNDQIFLEEIRKDVESDNYYKYGYLKGPGGELVQVGILANQVQALTDKFSIQNLVEELGSTGEAVYALFIDPNLTAVAHSDLERIGLVLNDVGSIAGAVRGEQYVSQYFYEPAGTDVFDFVVPVVMNGELMGALNLGFSIEQAQATLRQTLVRIALIGGIAFVVLGGVLLRMSLAIVSSLQANQVQLKHMGSGDFTHTVADKYLTKYDELGDMARAVENTQKAIRDVLHEVAETAIKVAGTSQELSASTEQTSASIEEVASTSNEFASTVQQMNDNSQAMVRSANQIPLLPPRERKGWSSPLLVPRSSSRQFWIWPVRWKA